MITATTAATTITSTSSTPDNNREYIKDNPLPPSSSAHSCTSNPRLHSVPSLGVPPKPRRDRSGTDSDREASPLQSANPLALCCDDNPINLRLLLRRMESVGFDCLAATSGEEAVARAKQLRRSDPPQILDLIMMDFHLPGIDGIEAVHQLRALDWSREPLCILNTADTSEDLKARASSAGIWEYLTKPFPVDVLRSYRDRVSLRDSQEDEDEGDEERNIDDELLEDGDGDGGGGNTTDTSTTSLLTSTTPIITTATTTTTTEKDIIVSSASIPPSFIPINDSFSPSHSNGTM
jgi:CheY-like chemotaxis protein